MILWCRLLLLAEITLNITRLCRTNPRILLYTALEGEFTCNDILLVPL